MWHGVCMAGETVTAVDGTHPTGMHSCVTIVLSNYKNNVDQ